MTILFSLYYSETWQKIRSGFGINKQTANPLHLDKTFIEVSSCGTVYFSKGGNSNFDDFPPHKTVPCKIPYVLGPIFIRSRRILKTSQFHLIRNNKSIFGGGFSSKWKLRTNSILRNFYEDSYQATENRKMRGACKRVWRHPYLSCDFSATWKAFSPQSSPVGAFSIPFRFL